MDAKVIGLCVFCPACKKGLHDRCWQHLGELLGHGFVPCPCGCRDEHGEMTHAALTDMMKRHPDVLARRIRFTEALGRGSLDLHLRSDHEGGGLG